MPTNNSGAIAPVTPVSGENSPLVAVFDNLDSIYLAHASKLHEVAATIRGTGRPNDALTIRYYDVEAGGWRSFKVENFVTVY